MHYLDLVQHCQHAPLGSIIASPSVQLCWLAKQIQETEGDLLCKLVIVVGRLSGESCDESGGESGGRSVV